MLKRQPEKVRFLEFHNFVRNAASPRPGAVGKSREPWLPLLRLGASGAFSDCVDAADLRAARSSLASHLGGAWLPGSRDRSHADLLRRLRREGEDPAAERRAA